MNYQPLEDRVLIRPIKKTEEEKTESGIILVQKNKDVSEGEVVAVGEGRYAPESGTFMPNKLTKGDVVLYGTNSGMEIEVSNGNGKEAVRVMREGDVLLVIKKKK